MSGDNAKPNRLRALLVAAALAAVGGAAFRAWRERAPLARSYRRAKRRRDAKGGDRGPNPEREPGTDPV